MFLIRGIVLTHEAVRDWETKLAPMMAEDLRKRRIGKASRCWHVDETYLKVAGEWCYLYRAIDRDGNLVDVYLSSNPLSTRVRFVNGLLYSEKLMLYVHTNSAP
ncbi:transposase-like protein [Skermanella aerolata]|uniref:DDE-type integrase/transposase/recombinase n=1 Tax=Skermanella aerolata TaxID=393310 RepID=UPI003D1A2976